MYDITTRANDESAIDLVVVENIAAPAVPVLRAIFGALGAAFTWLAGLF